MNTSYYANHKNFPTDKKPVSISIYPPRWMDIEHDITLAPSAGLLRDYKDKKIDQDGYVERYMSETLSKLNPKDVYDKHKNSILLCYEKPTDFCHRHIVSKWLNDAGYDACEYVKHTHVAVVGSRDFNDYVKLSTVLDKYLKRYKEHSIVSGGARGADFLASKYAEEHYIDFIEIKADWDTHGKSAGYIRNAEVIKITDVLIAFWDYKSKGTKHAIDLAHKKSIPYFIVDTRQKDISIAHG